jgi:hypothetical protein
MSKKFLVTILVVVAIGVGIYAYVGGFNSPEITVTTSKTLYVAGKPFNGSVKDKQLGEAFRRAAEVVKKKELAGVPGSIYYNNPDESGDSLKAFIGVLVPDSAVTLPSDYELRVVPGGKKIVHGNIHAHFMIAPKKLYEAIFDYAKEQNLQLENFYVEWFPSDNEAIVEVPLK